MQGGSARARTRAQACTQPHPSRQAKRARARALVKVGRGGSQDSQPTPPHPATPARAYTLISPSPPLPPSCPQHQRACALRRRGCMHGTPARVWSYRHTRACCAHAGGGGGGSAQLPAARARNGTGTYECAHASALAGEGGDGRRVTRTAAQAHKHSCRKTRARNHVYKFLVEDQHYHCQAAAHHQEQQLASSPSDTVIPLEMIDRLTESDQAVVIHACLFSWQLHDGCNCCSKWV